MDRLSTEKHSASTAVFRPIFEPSIKYVSYRDHRRFRTRVPSAVCVPWLSVRGYAQIYVSLALDMMWSDPEDIENWAVSPRGAGWLFGGNVTNEAS